MHVVHLMANNSSVPYFNWFAEKASATPDVRLSFVALHSERPRMLDEMPARGCVAHWIRFEARRRPRSMLLALPQLWQLFRRLRPDVMHSHLFDDSLPSLLAARLAGVRVRVVTKQDTSFHWLYAPAGVKYDRFNDRNATHIVAVSGECRDFLLERERADPAKVHLIHHGIPVERLSAQSEGTKASLRERFGLRDRFVVGTVARFIPWKGYRQIVEAAELVARARPDVRFLFVGEGDQRQEIEQLVRAKGLDQHVVFCGWVEREQIPSLYGVLDTYCHAAAFEPFGFVIAEAMANGVPVVSTATGAARDAIRHEENGFLSHERTGEALAEGILFMMQSDRRRIGEAGRRTAVEMYSVDRMWERHVALYRSATSHP
jgi:glycosyltransferase involved in cell wall biosynthesis